MINKLSVERITVGEYPILHIHMDTDKGPKMCPAVWLSVHTSPRRWFFPNWLWRVLCWVANAQTPEETTRDVYFFAENIVNMIDFIDKENL